MARDPEKRRRMTALVRRWEASDQTRAAFAREHGLRLSTFEYWKRWVRRQASEADVVAFRPVQVLTEPPLDTRAGLEVVLPDGTQLTIREGVSATLLRTVLEALRPSC